MHVPSYMHDRMPGEQQSEPGRINTLEDAFQKMLMGSFMMPPMEGMGMAMPPGQQLDPNMLERLMRLQADVRPEQEHGAGFNPWQLNKESFR